MYISVYSCTFFQTFHFYKVLYIFIQFNTFSYNIKKINRKKNKLCFYVYKNRMKLYKIVANPRI